MIVVRTFAKNNGQDLFDCQLWWRRTKKFNRSHILSDYLTRNPMMPYKVKSIWTMTIPNIWNTNTSIQSLGWTALISQNKHFPFKCKYNIDIYIGIFDIFPNEKSTFDMEITYLLWLSNDKPSTFSSFNCFSGTFIEWNISLK